MRADNKKRSNPPLNKLPRKYRKVAVVICRWYDITPGQLLSTTRGSPDTAIARQMLMLLLHVDKQETFTNIGKMLGRYRKTVSYGVEQSRIREIESPFFRLQLYRCRRDLAW